MKPIYLVLLELHVDHQHLGPHQNLIFDPRTCSGLSKRLEVLNASKNKMVDLAPIDELTALQSLNVSENQLSDLASTIDILAKMKNLKSFDLRGNPLTKLLRYRESIIVSNINSGICNQNFGKIIQKLKKLPSKTWKFITGFR